jgi:hypothetical protein
MDLVKQNRRHRNAVEKINGVVDGVIFHIAPFDIVSKDGRVFYEIKCLSKRVGRHRHECHIPISENERKFGDIFKNNYVFIIFFKRRIYVIPFIDMCDRINRNKISVSHLNGSKRLKRIITLGKRFMSGYKRCRNGIK